LTTTLLSQDLARLRVFSGDLCESRSIFVRVALYFGVELIFIPPGEPKRNSEVERVNGLWARSFWDRNNFRSAKDVRRKSVKFLRWYLDYAPPALCGKSVREASRKQRCRKLRKKECEALPQALPLTEGRIHYIRRIDVAGCIEILKERFKVSKSLRGQYVTASVNLKEKSLSIYYRRSAKSKAKLLKKFDYKIEEKIEKLQPRYKRARRRKVDILQII